MPGPFPPRPEYPRPQLRRTHWTNLNGVWRFAFDDDDVGAAEGWAAVRADELEDAAPPFERRITVPFPYQSAASGIGDDRAHDVVWYARVFDDPRAPAAAAASGRCMLHFGAVDYRATVWVNGVRVAEHEGGHTPFSAEVGQLLGERNVVVVRAHDPASDVTIPRGKQDTRPEPGGIFYTPTSGIWQTVWAEPLPTLSLAGLRLTPDVDSGSVDLEADLAGPVAAGATVRVIIRLDELVLVDDVVRVTTPRLRRRYPLESPLPEPGSGRGVALWSPEHPRLYDLRLEVAAGDQVDVVDSYFGLRKIEASDGRVLLNNRPCYLRLVLDQGYFPGGLLAAPDDQALRADIELAKRMGFNGARKHQKVEDPRWLYWADRLGFLVWAEMPAAYRFTADAACRVTREWQAVVRRDYNHPCVIVWVPVNESWGVPELAADPRQVDHLLALYHLTRSLDGTRLVVSNDGWEHARSDLCTVHDYGDPTALRARYGNVGDAVAARPAGRPLYAPGHAHRGEPLLLSEIGGVAISGDPGTWGYHVVPDGDTLAERYAELIAAVTGHDAVAGFCYTQLTDVQQEANGLLRFDRRPKADLERLRAATLQASG